MLAIRSSCMYEGKADGHFGVLGCAVCKCAGWCVWRLTKGATVSSLQAWKHSLWLQVFVTSPFSTHSELVIKDVALLLRCVYVLGGGWVTPEGCKVNPAVGCGR